MISTDVETFPAREAGDESPEFQRSVRSAEFTAT